jgi:protein O-mannosyl-transferase
MFARTPRWTAPALGVGLVVVLACALYWPFLRNPLVFDDWTFFSGVGFYYYATHPIGLQLRTPPLFTLAATEVLIGGVKAHRIVSLVFHVLCALCLFKLIYDLMRATLAAEPQGSEPEVQRRAIVYASIGAAAFAIHPVAVYGAGYLVQRTIVMATLFSLLSVVFFARGLARRSHADAVTAALMYTIALFCKEHSLLLPAAAVLTIALIKSERRFAFRHAAIYLAACAPAALYVVVFRAWLIGKAYEPDYAVVANQLEGVFGHAMKDFSLPLSVVTQAGLFFKYLALWVWPDVRAMSLDMRVDFFQTWSALWIVLKVSAFLAFGALGGLLLRRGGRMGLVGFGMLYTWLLFLLEFSTARFQEPMVLYRSYLWAPGIVLALMALLSAVPLRAALAASALALPVLFYQAHDRLTTFSTSLLLWEDAVAKLPAAPVPWGSRTLYMLGREYVYNEQPDKASEIADRCMAQYPETVHCYYARGVIYFLLGEYEKALPYVTHAVELQPESGIAHHRLGLILENLGRIQDALAEYRRAVKLGYEGAQYEIDRLESPVRKGRRGPSTTGLPAHSGTASAF